MATLAAAGSSDGSAVLLQYGAVGVLALLGIFVGRLLLARLLLSFDQTRTQFQEALNHEREALSHERARGDRLEQALQKLYDVTQGANMDAMRETASALNQALDVLDRERRRRNA